MNANKGFLNSKNKKNLTLSNLSGYIINTQDDKENMDDNFVIAHQNRFGSVNLKKPEGDKLREFGYDITNFINNYTENLVTMVEYQDSQGIRKVKPLELKQDKNDKITTIREKSNFKKLNVTIQTNLASKVFINKESSSCKFKDSLNHNKNIPYHPNTCKNKDTGNLINLQPCPGHNPYESKDSINNLNPVNYVPTPTNMGIRNINQNQKMTSIYRQKKNTSFNLEYPTPFINQQYFPIQSMKSNSKSKSKANLISNKSNSKISRNNSCSRGEKNIDRQQTLNIRRSSAKPVSSINLCVNPSSLKSFSISNKENIDMNTFNQVESINSAQHLRNNYLSENLTSNNYMIIEHLHNDENMFSENEATGHFEEKLSQKCHIGGEGTILQEDNYHQTVEKVPAESIIPESYSKDVNMNHNPISTNTATIYPIFIQQQLSYQQNENNPNSGIFSSIINSQSFKSTTLPLHIQELIEEIYSNLLIEETSLNLNNSLLVDYMTHQSDINEQMRAILLDWMIEVHLKFHLKDETLFLAVYLIDRYLCHQAIQRSRLQLMGVACLMIACKQEEILTPHVKDFVYITDKAYTKLEVLEMEKEVLKVLNFNLLFPSSYRFYQILAQFFKFTKKQFMFGRYLLETCLIGYRMTKYLPSMLAASCAYIVMKFFNFDNYQIVYAPFILGESINPHTSKVSQLKECAREIIYLLENLGSTNLTAVKRKFSEKEFCCVASINLN